MSIRAKVALSPAQAKASAALSHYGSRTTEPMSRSSISATRRSPEDVAGLVSYLAGPDSDYMTVDGGLVDR